MKEKKNQLKVNFENVDHSLYLIDYIRRKIHTPKFSQLKISPKEISIKRDHTKGGKQFVLSVSVIVNKVVYYFKEMGNNLYALIDAVIRKINQKLSRIKNTRMTKTSLKYML